MKQSSMAKGIVRNGKVVQKTSDYVWEQFIRGDQRDVIEALKQLKEDLRTLLNYAEVMERDVRLDGLQKEDAVR